MRVKDLIKVLQNCDEESDVSVWDSSTGETIKIGELCDTEDGDDTLSFEIDCKRNPHLEAEFKPLIKKWKDEAKELHLKENFLQEHKFEFELLALRPVTTLLYQKITELEWLEK